mgnify:CR=1 FL=1
MDSILNEESKNEPVEQAGAGKTEQPAPVVRRRKPAKKSTFHIRIPEFLKHLGDDVKWYYDIRLWSPVLVILFILALLPGKKTEKPAVQETVPAVTVVETQPVAAETQPAQTTVNPEAEALARLADSVGAGRSDNVKIAIMWVAINRSEDRANGYGQDLLTEINRANQWQGYDPNLPYTQGTYEMALEVLDTRVRGRLRPVDSDMLWLVLNDDGSVTLRNKFNAAAHATLKTVK